MGVRFIFRESVFCGELLGVIGVLEWVKGHEPGGIQRLRSVMVIRETT